MQKHPDFSFHFWRTEVPGVAREVQTLLGDPRYTVIVKSDVLRYELLRVYGGIYVDSDVECLRPFDRFLTSGFFCGWESERFLCPSVLGAVPGHPLAALLVDEALRRVAGAGVERSNCFPNEVTGPHLLTELATGRDDVEILPRERFYPIGWWETNRLGENTPDSYAKHWWRGASSVDGWTKQLSFSIKKSSRKESR